MEYNKFEIRKFNDSVSVEISKVGSKGQMIMKMCYLHGQDSSTREIIKNLIVNIAL
jgi:hypothetical protein